MEASTELVGIYCTELELKTAIVNGLGDAEDHNRQVLYLSAWLQQPYLATKGPQLYATLDWDAGSGRR